MLQFQSRNPGHVGQLLGPGKLGGSGIPRCDFHISMAQPIAGSFQAVASQSQVVGMGVAQGVRAHLLCNARFLGNSPYPPVGGFPGHIEKRQSPQPSAPATLGPGLRVLPHPWTCPPCPSRKDTTSHRPGTRRLLSDGILPCKITRY